MRKSFLAIVLSAFMLCFALTACSHSFVVEYLADEGGYIQGDPIQTVAPNGETSTVVAMPNEGFRFVKWTDDVETAQRSDIVTEDISVAAIFEPITYTVEYKASTGGYIDGEQFQIVNYNENASTVTAVADSGYTFVKWSDNVLELTRTDENIKGNISVTAIFEAE